ncbi:MAG: hypothetical protein BWK77_04950 [Verrucomicrobia bacterium A1]|nr:MAG: hypothetical protein BWK77_04950 [Verrucomicrobia bacterium A1]
MDAGIALVGAALPRYGWRHVSSEPTDTPTPPAPPRDIRRVAGFVVLSLVLVGASLLTPVRAWADMDRISAWTGSLGAWGPVAILLLGLITPLLFIPRWPIAFASGLLYGTLWGTGLANVASCLGAVLHYAMSRSLLAPWCRRLLEKRRSSLLDIPRDRAFLALFLLRAFPLSNFVATNILAGTLRIPFRTYLAATFLGMIPSSLMYAAWGKLMKKPSPEFYAVAVASLVFIVAGTLLARRFLGRWTRGPGGVAETLRRDAP